MPTDSEPADPGPGPGPGQNARLCPGPGATLWAQSCGPNHLPGRGPILSGQLGPGPGMTAWLRGAVNVDGSEAAAPAAVMEEARPDLGAVEVVHALPAELRHLRGGGGRRRGGDGERRRPSQTRESGQVNVR
jgi:hypothetical protein